VKFTALVDWPQPKVKNIDIGKEARAHFSPSFTRWSLLYLIVDEFG